MTNENDILELTSELFEAINETNIYLIETSSPGGMGYSGSIRITYIIDGVLHAAQTDIRQNEELYFLATEWTFDHSDNYPEYLMHASKANKKPLLPQEPEFKQYFDSIYTSMGTHVFIRKDVEYQTDEHKILCKVEGNKIETSTWVNGTFEYLERFVNWRDPA